MKTERFILIALLALTACNGIQNIDSSTSGELTLYVTQIVGLDNEPNSAIEIESTPPLHPTEAPIIHIVTLGETISSIALMYGVTIDAIMVANPEIKPTVLIVGDEIIIPTSDRNHLFTVDSQIIAQMQISDPHCVTMRDGLWCGLMVENVGDLDVENVIVTYKFLDTNGVLVKESSSPALMRQISSDATTPATVFIENMSIENKQVIAEITFASYPDLESLPTYDVTIEGVNKSINDLKATISGKLRVEGEKLDDQVDISVGAAAFDATGNLVGVRRLDSAVPLNELFDFSVSVYSTGAKIVEVTLYQEVY